MKTRYRLLVLYLATVALWCAVDWYDVRVNQQKSSIPYLFEVIFWILLPALAGLVVFRKERERQISTRIFLGIAASAGFAALVFVWLLTGGIPFHMWLGGSQ